MQRTSRIYFRTPSRGTRSTGEASVCISATFHSLYFKIAWVIPNFIIQHRAAVKVATRQKRLRLNTYFIVFDLGIRSEMTIEDQIHKFLLLLLIKYIK